MNFAVTSHGTHERWGKNVSFQNQLILYFTLRDSKSARQYVVSKIAIRGFKDYSAHKRSGVPRGFGKFCRQCVKCTLYTDCTKGQWAKMITSFALPRLIGNVMQSVLHIVCCRAKPLTNCQPVRLKGDAQVRCVLRFFKCFDLIAED
jgi:hypothetical protein